MKRARSLIHLKEAYGILIKLSLRSLRNSLLSNISHFDSKAMLYLRDLKMDKCIENNIISNDEK